MFSDERKKKFKDFFKLNQEVTKQYTFKEVQNLEFRKKKDDEKVDDQVTDINLKSLRLHYLLCLRN